MSRWNRLWGRLSLNDLPLDPFVLKVRWPSGVAPPRQAFVAPGGGRRLTALHHVLQGNWSQVHLPSIDTHATLLLLQSSEPLLAVDAPGARRGTAGLLHVNPGDRIVLTVSVHNPCDERRPEGRIGLRLPRGWLADHHRRRVRSLKPWGSRSVRFTISAPALCAARRLRAICLRYQAGELRSTPATELVWWEPAP